ncbi:MAG: uncharacterized protein QG651_313 [Pseudomonadota bacterium]|jgi:uncharacterized protein (DUF2237 family)|nr:DUF2237 domain-containing protein [Burkholderiales bacterium]MBP9769723.1 DUF2237 domain-containing protein [Burkholderiales bacterium]MDQ5947819.1 uncharacterized protein [Pseudomonadota bacterium]HCY39083.1 DUF2237 domain-containing protein [Neisseriales bacterium]
MQLNILGEPLEACCFEPITGWMRDGFCGTYEGDAGMHHVCIKVDNEFLCYSKAQGNDLSTATEYFPGLKPGDKWCLCTLRWLQAFNANMAPKIYLKSTSIDVLHHIPLVILQQMACDV